MRMQAAWFCWLQGRALWARPGRCPAERDCRPTHWLSERDNARASTREASFGPDPKRDWASPDRTLSGHSAESAQRAFGVGTCERVRCTGSARTLSERDFDSKSDSDTVEVNSP